AHPISATADLDGVSELAVELGLADQFSTQLVEIDIGPELIDQLEDSPLVGPRVRLPSKQSVELGKPVQGLATLLVVGVVQHFRPGEQVFAVEGGQPNLAHRWLLRDARCTWSIVRRP